MGRRGLTAVTLTTLSALLVVGLFVGWRTLSAPVGDPSADGSDDTSASPSCDSGLRAGDVVRSSDVTVSVYNGGTVNGLADRTRDALVKRGFLPGDAGNAPDTFSVQFVRVLAPTKNDPAAALVAAQFGPNTLVQVSRDDLGPGVDVIVGDELKGLAKAPRKLRAAASGSGC